MQKIKYISYLIGIGALAAPFFITLSAGELCLRLAAKIEKQLYRLDEWIENEESQ